MHFAAHMWTPGMWAPGRVVYDSRMVVLARWISTISFVACGVVACGGTQFTAASDAGVSAPQGDAQGDDGPAASTCVTPPSATGDEADFCTLEAHLFDGCKQCEACRQTDLNNCVALGDALSATFKSALDTCADQVACGDYTTYAGDPCVRAKLANAAPTSDQALAKTKYCTQCETSATGTTDCLDFFDPAQTDGGAAGIGYIVLLSSDDIATSIATACSSDCGAVLYQACAITQFCKGQAADACGTGYCGK